MSNSIRAIIVSHTHWDRAWYQPFEAYRTRLVRTVDRLLTILETQPDFRSFTLDGQTVVLEDDFEIRPDHRERIARLVRAGRLFIGPWYTLPDLFLASGEAIVRNLQIGIEVCTPLGGAMRVGYVPDPFGHFAQLPQVLRGFGIDTFIFMRGMDADMKRTLGTLFRWRAPDGSDVLTVYQPHGYMGASALGHPSIFGRFDGHEPRPELAKATLTEALESTLPHQKERTVLVGNGGDHMPPQPELPTILSAVREQLPHVEIVHGSFADFFAAIREEGHVHAAYEGDLLGNADHPILLSVYSTRMYLKQQNHRALSALLRYAEPVSAWLRALGLGHDPQPFLLHAWKLLLRNHAHDDICGCSQDPVHREDEVRFAQVEQIAHTLVTEHLEALLAHGFAAPDATSARCTDLFVFNPHPFPLRTTVRTSILLSDPEGEFGPAAPARRLLGTTADGDTVDVRIRQTLAKQVRSAFLETTWGRRYDIECELDLPPLGYELLHLHETDEDPVPLRIVPTGLASAGTRVSFTAGELVIEREGRTLRCAPLFEYETDTGDTYSFSSAVGQAPRLARCTHEGAHRPDTLDLTYELDVPASYDRVRGPAPDIVLRISVQVSLDPQGDVQFRISYRNEASDGRLRMLLPVGFVTTRSFADGHFRIAERMRPNVDPAARAPVAYPGEFLYPTHHQGDFVYVEDGAFRVWVANRGLPEYELVELNGQTHVALTLHRAVARLSVNAGSIRGCHAGPSIPTPEAQCHREFVHEVAWGFGHLSAGEIVTRALAFSHPPLVQEMPLLPHLRPTGDMPRRHSLLAYDAPLVRLEAFHATRENALAVRLCNLSGEPQQTTLRFGLPLRAACESTLEESWQEARRLPIDNGCVTVSLRPHEIHTILVRT